MWVGSAPGKPCPLWLVLRRLRTGWEYQDLNSWYGKKRRLVRLKFDKKMVHPKSLAIEIDWQGVFEAASAYFTH